MNWQSCGLELEVNQPHPKFYNAQVSIPAQVINRLYKEASLTQRGLTHIPGFSRGNTPLKYIETAYKTHILSHLKEFLLRYAVTGFLYQQMREKKLFFAGEPRLENINIELDKDAHFNFVLSACTPLTLRGWKYYSFKPPKRKNYRDLDRQVELFLKTEEEAVKKASHAIQVNDWVCFEISIVDKDKAQLFPNQHLWLRIGAEEADLPYQELFVGKTIGDQFYSTSSVLQEYFSDELDTHYLFRISITDIVYDATFNIEDFKTNFKLRTHKDLHKKLIEVFSYRNDISQRRETVEEVFKLLLSQHQIEVPHHLVYWKQQSLLNAIQENPDYSVYRQQADFNANLQRLAVKLIAQAILMDQLAVKESITINHQDIKNYLNLIKRPRTKEFVYFDLPSTRVNGQEVPIDTEVLKHYALREKTLNYVIYHLTRK